MAKQVKLNVGNQGFTRSKYRRGAYGYGKIKRSQLTSVETIEGDRLETKIQRLTHNKEPIKDGAPSIYTEKKDGVLAAYNIRADRWELATEAMDHISKQELASGDGKVKTPDESGGGDSGAESTQGTESA